MKAGTRKGLGTLLRRLLELTDGELEAVYREEHPSYTPRFTPIMKVLATGARPTIRELAELGGTSHSAASQTVTRMQQLGLLELLPGDDRRSRVVTLTAAGRELLPWLERRWHMTRLAADDLERELSGSLSGIIEEAIAALERRSFADRIRARRGAGKDGHP